MIKPNFPVSTQNCNLASTNQRWNALDKQAALWIHDWYREKITKSTIQQRLAKFTPDERETMVDRLNHYNNMRG